MSENWIKTSDEPPRKDIPILVWNEFLDFPVSVHWKEDGTYGEPGFFENGDEYEIKQISYWMPLALPPKLTTTVPT